MSATQISPEAAADSPKQASQRRLEIFTIKDSDKVTVDSTKNTYDHVIKDGSEKDTHLYLEVAPLGLPGNDNESRLKTIETQQKLLQQDFRQFKTDITSEIVSLKEINTRLMILVQESSEKLQDSMDRLLLKFSENSDHLGQHIMDVRRDIVAVAKRQQSTTTQPNTAQTHVHAFEWEVTNIDSLLKNQKECSSHVYHIPHIDYRIHGSVVGHKDGRMCLTVAGEFGPSVSRNSLPRNGKFECTAHVLDKSDKLSEMFVGKVSGDFTRETAWFLGELSASDVKKKGFVAKGGNIILKCTVEMSR